MARERTRGALLRRVNRYNSSSTDENREVVLEYLNDAYATVFEQLSASNDGFGRVEYDHTFATTTDVLELPANFSRLFTLTLNPGTEARELYYISPESADFSYSSATYTFGYWMEGPGSTTSDGITFTPYDVRLRFSEPIPAGTVLRLRYAQQPPTLADVAGNPLEPFADDAQDETVSVDVFTEGIEQAVCNYARVFAANRDSKEMGHASQLLSAAVSQVLTYRVGREQVAAQPVIPRRRR